MELLKRARKAYSRPDGKVRAAVDILKRDLAEKKSIDVSAGKERELNVSQGILAAALAILKDESYQVRGLRVLTGSPEKVVCSKVISAF